MRRERGKTMLLHVYVAYLFIGLITVYALITGWYQYRQTSHILLNEAADRIRLFAEQTSARVNSLYAPALVFTEQLAIQRVSRATSLEQRLDYLGYFVTGLRLNPELASAYIGYPDGEFFLVRGYRESPELKALFSPPAGTAWIVQSVEREGEGEREVLHGQYLFFDERLKLLQQRPEPAYRYDPRKRAWYRAAQLDERMHVSDPSLFHTTREVGVTFSRTASPAGVVAATDLSLNTLQALIGQQRLTPSTRLLLINARDEVLSWSEAMPAPQQQAGPRQSGDSPRLPTLVELFAPEQREMIATLRSGTGLVDFEHEGRRWQGMGVEVPVPHAQPMRLWADAPQSELVANAITIRNNATLVALLFLAIGIAAAYALSRLVSRALDELTLEADHIERFEFDRPVAVNSSITEIADLARSMGSMKNTIRHFLDISDVLANEQNFQQLLRRLLDEFRAVTGALGGVVYLADDAGNLQAAHAGWHEHNGHSDEQQPALSQLGRPACLSSAEALRAPSHREPLSGNRARELFGTLVPEHAQFTLLTVPLRDRGRELLGALALFVDESRHLLTPERVAFTEALSGTAAVALNTQRLIEEQKVLMESFIQVMAGAIDAKSPYTGGHCQRVPELAKLLARAACDVTSGPFADFQLSDSEWEELHVAAWLHDCGKVTTPEYIVDKATKLETLHDRIHEVRMRFELLKRDAEIDYWRAVAEEGIAKSEERERLHAQLQARWRELDADFSFVAQCNQGGEFLSAEDQARLQKIAAMRWRRTLSDRIGISHEELARKSVVPEPPLPCEEPLLADKPEHRFERFARDTLAADNPWGFKVDVPRYLYDRGELHNLRVSRGTLSDEERYKINEHMIQTIKMLDQLPFPRYLRRVPEIAGGHHEKMDGTGYPKRLAASEMSVLARMMAVADIFEALTAIDRPYKKGKTLSETVNIMARMAREQHIDRDLFALFLRQDVHLSYARRFMRPEQIDEVDIEAALA